MNTAESFERESIQAAPAQTIIMGECYILPLFYTLTKVSDTLDA